MNRSESIKNLAAALAAFQAEVQNPKNTAKNPYFNSKYAPLQEVLNVVRPLLSKHGLSILQSPSTATVEHGKSGDSIVVKTLLMHSSGEWIESDPLVLKMDKLSAQGAGSAITYARRYSLSAVLGISSEDDDDGNHAENSNENINDEQKKIILDLIKKKNISSKDMKEIIENRYRKSDSKTLTKSEADDLIEFLKTL